MPKNLSLIHDYPVPTTIGPIELVLVDSDGTIGKMSTRGTLHILDRDGLVIATRNGDPREFMPVEWQQQVKQVLDDLRAKVTSKLVKNS